jgi:hypothetical protein
MAETRKKVKIEMAWPCTSCQTRNMGRDLVCVSCGSPRKHTDHGESYVLPADLGAARVTDESLKATFSAGPNWHCENCGSDQRRADGSCLQCGANKQENDEPTPSAIVPPPQRNQPEDDRRERTHAPSFNWRGLLTAAGVVTGSVAAVAAIAWLLWPRDMTATVASTRWEYVSVLSQRKVNDGEGWKRSAPGGAYGFVCQKRKSGTEKCHPYDCNPHKVYETCYDTCPRVVEVKCRPRECNCRIDRSSCVADGAGGADCDEVCDTCYDTCKKTVEEKCRPHDCNGRTVYDTCYDTCDVMENWCTYEYDTWPTINTQRMSGTGRVTEWPALVANGPDQRLKRTESYRVEFSNDEDAWTYKPDGLADYRRFAVGEEWRATVMIGGIISPIAPVTTTEAE